MSRLPVIPSKACPIEVKAKTYYGERLLALGPLHYNEFLAITGWQPETCDAVLSHMRKTRVIEQCNGVWRLRP